MNSLEEDFKKLCRHHAIVEAEVMRLRADNAILTAQIDASRAAYADLKSVADKQNHAKDCT